MSDFARQAMTIETGAPASDQTDAEARQEVRLYSHSPLLYWWPVWVGSLTLGVVSLATGDVVQLDAHGGESMIASSAIGVVFVLVLLMVIGFTSVRMRGIVSVTAILAVVLALVLISYAGLWDAIFALVPSMSVHMNAGFYFFFGGALAVMWTLQFFVFDRLTYYRILPGQMIEEHMIGGGERSFDTNGLLFEQKNDDFFRHRLLGLGAGDIELVTDDARREKITLENVLFVERRVSEIQKLIVVRPDAARS